MTSIFVYDDNIARQDCLKAIIDISENMQLVGTAINCKNVLAEMATTNPDVVLMDIEMPGVNGIAGVGLIKANYPHIKVIMQTAFDDTDKIFEALKNGAEGYILKSASINNILQSIDDVLQGGAYMTPSVAIKVANYFNVTNKATVHVNYNLTTKEKEVLSHLANGDSYKMVADAMGISYYTVNNHIKKIYEKLQVHSLGEAVALAHRNKIV